MEDSPTEDAHGDDADRGREWQEVVASARDDVQRRGGEEAAGVGGQGGGGGKSRSDGARPEDNYIENVATGERIELRIERGTYVFDVEFDDGERGTIVLDSVAGVSVWPKDLRQEVLMLPRDPGLRMTAANNERQHHREPRGEAH